MAGVGMAAEIEFLVGDATVDMVRSAWTEVLEEIKDSSTDAHAEAELLGADLGPLTVDNLVVEGNANDFGATIIVAFTVDVAVHVVVSLWDDFVRPRIQRRFGVDTGETVK
jgi:hypothetical protein